MTALPRPALPETIRNEMARLKGAGLHLLPLGGGANGKSPLTRTWTATLTLSQILAPMHRTGSMVYAVRLDGLAVVDCDTDDPALVAAMEARFGPSPVHVKTPRGRHLYFRAGGVVPNLRGEGLPVDIKTGGRSYVAGPQSVRPDGGFYDPVRGVLGHDPLPVLRTAFAAPDPVDVAPDAVPEGARHATLVKEAIAIVEQVSSKDELGTRLAAVRDATCANPATVPDSELATIVDWAWGKRLEGKVFQGRNSGFMVPRAGLRALQGQAEASDAIALWINLQATHGHMPGKLFALDHAAMRGAGLTDLSPKGFLAARRALERAGLLRLAEKHRAGTRCQTFILCRPRPDADPAHNVLDMFRPSPNSAGGGRRGGGLRLHMSVDLDCHTGIMAGAAPDPS